MLDFERITLANGLRILVHRDTSTPVVAFNVLYDVGARDENPTRTGLAHLFEHFMFEGSANIPKYDLPLQLVGGENNAFTTNDITNYYLTLPRHNIETAFWLESDRMLKLAFIKEHLDVQKDVVTEEFKQVHLNQPYGDVWQYLRPLAYKVHPYRWDTIGMKISHIQGTKLSDMKDFHKRFYCPNNAILSVAGNVDIKEIKRLADKWFAPIPAGAANKRKLPPEPVQKKARKLTLERNVPLNAIYKAYHCCARNDDEFFATDILSNILSEGKSSRLYVELLKKKRLFSEIDASLSGDFDKGLFIVSGKLTKGVKMETAEKAIINELQRVQDNISKDELQKVKNRLESSYVFSKMNVMSKAINLAIFELLGDADLINSQLDKYNAVTAGMVMQQAKTIFTESNCSTIYYKAKK